MPIRTDKRSNGRLVMRRWKKIFKGRTGKGVSIKRKAHEIIDHFGGSVRIGATKTELIEIAATCVRGKFPSACAPAHTPEPIKSGSRNGKSKSFYSTWDWKKLRYEALKIHGTRCQCCGWQPGDTDHGHLVVDHIKPRSKFPALQLDLNNLQVLCNDCNMGKSNIHEDDFRGVDDWLAQIGRE